jgi:hypothetical protein
LDGGNQPRDPIIDAQKKRNGALAFVQEASKASRANAGATLLASSLVLFFPFEFVCVDFLFGLFYE